MSSTDVVLEGDSIEKEAESARFSEIKNMPKAKARLENLEVTEKPFNRLTRLEKSQTPKNLPTIRDSAKITEKYFSVEISPLTTGAKKGLQKKNYNTNGSSQVTLRSSLSDKESVSIRLNESGTCKVIRVN